ncbi:MAG: cyclopropane fatty acyl phospholipid synthase [Candidatus Acidiferrales bacterium]
MPSFGLKERIQRIFSPAGITIGGDRPWDIVVGNSGFYPRVLRLGSLGLGEAYMDGWWDCGALDEFFYRILRAGLDRKRICDWHLALSSLWATVLNRQTPSRSKRVAEQHYDLDNDLYQKMLDRRMVYTCARWEHVSNLNEAQEAKLDFVCRKLDLKPGMLLLDIGCGWGSLAKYAAEKYGVRAVGITLSREQMQLGQQMCADLPVEIRLQDYRDVREKFDRVASLGMFEHVGYKNYRSYFELAHRALAPGGLFFLSTIGTNHSVRVCDPWIAKYIFPNSHLPSPTQLSAAVEGLFIVEEWQNWRADYDRTVMAWFQNFQKSWNQLKLRYDERFYRMWKYYLMASAGSFRSQQNQDWQIVLARQ